MYPRHGVSLKPTRDIKPLLAVAKKSCGYSWLKEYDSLALQQAVINLDKAFAHTFNQKFKARSPIFKSKNGKQSSDHPNGKVLTDAIPLPKIPAIRANIHRGIVGKVSGKYFASILPDDGQAAPAKPTDITNVADYDLGLSHYMIGSDGGKVANPRHLVNANRRKARLRLPAQHERVANVRADFQHKLSRKIIDENQAVMMETLKSTNMMKNRRLARHIGDAAWSGFVAKLAYKAESAGVHRVKLDQWFTRSKNCHCCGHKMPEMLLKVGEWKCLGCNADHDRDINAAIDIQHKGRTELMAAGHVVKAHRSLRKPGFVPVTA